MSEPTKETKTVDQKIAEAKAAVANVPTIQQAREHLNKIQSFLFGKDDQGKPKFEGRPGFNPFLYASQVINPLSDKLATYEAGGDNAGEAAPTELLRAILAIRIDVVPDASSLRKDSLIARDRKNMIIS